MTITKDQPRCKQCNTALILDTESKAYNVGLADDLCPRCEEEQYRNGPVMTAIRDLAARRKTLNELAISTTEKITVCLACELPLPKFCTDEKDAWERLNYTQRRVVANINPKFQAQKWTDIPVYFG